MRAEQRREWRREIPRGRSACVGEMKLAAEGGLLREDDGNRGEKLVPRIVSPHESSSVAAPAWQAMAQKRNPEEEKGNPGAGEKRQKVPDLGSVIVEVMKMNALQKLLSVIEPQLRRVVKEEVETALAKHLATMKRQCGKQIYPSSSRCLQLQFVSKLSLPIFTGTKIEAEDSSGISLALVDIATRKIVVSGPESLIKVELVVLEGDFEVEEENWSFEEFKSNIVKEREGKRPLLSGDVFLDLVEGSGVLGELAFTDNSSWTRSRKFRLGARVEDGYFNGVRIREAKSEPFMVKDHRGELYKKHYPPSLTDEVWRLEKIGKDGAFHKRLCNENINTVKDFLTMLNLDTQRLRNILGTGMSAKMWEVTMEHARTCVMGTQLYTYYPGRQTKTGVAFNIVGNVVGVISDGQFVPAAELSEAQKADAHKLVKAAYEHWEDVSLFDSGATTCNSSHASSVSFPHALSDPFYQTDSFSFSSVLPCSTLHTIDSIESGCNIPPFFSHALYSEQRDHLFSSPLVFDGESSNQTLFSDDQLHYFDAADVPLLSGDSPADLGSAVSGFLAAAARGKVNRRWRTLISVLKWRFSIKRIVSLRRKLNKDRYAAQRESR